MDVRAPADNRRFRSLFISDVHLGARGCQAEKLLDFLRWHEADTIYLVGDIVDGWALRSGWFWPQSHNDVVQKLLRQARKGVRIVYVPGNHDEFLRDYYGTHFGGIVVSETAIHVGADGRRYLVIHGDHFDLVVTQARWLALLGGKAYDWAIVANRMFNQLRRRLGFPYWSLSQWLKLKVKNAVNYIGDFEKALVAEAQRHDVHGVICGHIHHAAIHEDFGIRYLNCGDWVESCTAIAEHHDGRFEIVTWTGGKQGTLAPAAASLQSPRGLIAPKRSHETERSRNRIGKMGARSRRHRGAPLGRIPLPRWGRDSNRQAHRGGNHDPHHHRSCCDGCACLVLRRRPVARGILQGRGGCQEACGRRAEELHGQVRTRCAEALATPRRERKSSPARPRTASPRSASPRRSAADRPVCNRWGGRSCRPPFAFVASTCRSERQVRSCRRHACGALAEEDRRSR